MAKQIDIDEDEFNRLKALQGVASKIVGNPAARKMLEQAHKLVDPNALTPMLDQEAQHLGPVKELEKSFNDKIAAIEKERAEEKKDATLREIAARQTQGIAKLRQQGWLDAGIEKVQKIMEDKGLLDVEDAVAIFERTHPPQMPASPSGMTGTAWGFAEVNADSDKSIQELIASKGQNEHVADKMAMAALNDFRQSVGRR